MDAVIGRLAEDGCDGIFLVGQPGVGTTRVLDVVHDRWCEEGGSAWRVVGSRATHGTRFGALSHVLPGPLHDSSAPLDQVSLFQRMRDEMGGTVRRPRDRMVVCVDDVRWLDDDSLGLLTQLLTAGLAILVATLHDDDVLPDALDTIERSCAIRRVVVPPLTPAQTLEVIEQALDGPVDGSTARALADACQGNPLFLGEIIDGSVATGALAAVLGTWTLRGQPDVTARLARLLDAQLATLDDNGRELVDLIALSEPVSLDAVEAAGLLPTAVALEAAGFLTSHAGSPSRLRVAQPLVGAQVRARTTPLRRRSLLPQAIEMVSVSPTDDDLVRLAKWRLECGQPVTVTELERAAAIARRDNDFETIAELAAAAVAIEPTLNTLLLQAEALFDLCHFDEADEVMRQAEALVTDDLALLRLAVVRHRALLWSQHDGAASARVMEDAIAVLSMPVMRDFARAALANAVVFSGQPDAVERLMADLEGDGRMEQAAMFFPRAVAAVLEGRLEEAVALGHEGIERRAEFSPRAPLGHPALSWLALGFALLQHGQFQAADEALDIGYTMAVEQKIPQLQIWLAQCRGRAALFQGRIGDARRWFTESRSAADRARFTTGSRLSLTGLLVCACHVRDLETGRLIDRALRELPDDHGLLWPERHLGHAWFAAAEGRSADALAALRTGVAEAAERGEVLLQAELLYEAARMGDARDVLAEYTAVAARCDGPLQAARLQFVTGSARNDHVALAAAEKQFANMDAWLPAAESAGELARVLHERDRPRDAQAAANRAAQYLSDVTMVATPKLVRQADPAIELSPREREVAVLAADGMPSKAIARQLGLSVRTVSNHLQNAYLKLSISGRSDLPDAIAALR